MATLETVLGTTGDDTLSTDLLKDFVVDGLAGDDTITIEESASAFQVQSRAGADSLTANGAVTNADKVKTGADDDALTFKGAVTNSSVYAGKGTDSLTFERTVSGGLVSGDTGNDTIDITGKISASAVISGGADDDSIVLRDRIESSTVRGDDGEDTLSILDNSVSSKVLLGGDNDTLTVDKKHVDLTVKGNAGDDTLTVGSTTATSFSGSGNAFYGGKGEDTLNLQSNDALLISGDKEDDLLEVTVAITSDGATLNGGEGDDVIDLATAVGGKLTAKGEVGADSIVGSAASDSVYGGQGDDTLTGGSGGTDHLQGDLGDDVITLATAVASLVLGGDGDDTITQSTVSSSTEKGHTITGGAGADSISTVSQTFTAAGAINTDKTNTVVTFANAAEFFTSGDVVDSISVADGDGTILEIGGALKFDVTDEFDRLSMSGTGAARTALTEGFMLKTTDSVTAGADIKFVAAAGDVITAVDTSSSNQNSSIDASNFIAADPIAIVGAENGKNTIKGGKGDDVLTGGDKVDTILGGDGDDTLVSGEGNDTLTGGAGNDLFTLGKGTNVVTDLSGSDLFTLAATGTAAVTVTADFTGQATAAKFTNKAANTAAVFTLADGKDIDLRASVDTSSGVKISAAGNATKSDITGTDLADIIVGSAGADSIAGELGADTIDVGSETGVNNKVLLETITSADTITNFEAGANKDEIQFDLSTINTELAGLVTSSTLLKTTAVDGTTADSDTGNAAISNAIASSSIGSAQVLPVGEIFLISATTSDAAMNLLNGTTGDARKFKASASVQDGDGILVMFEDANDNFVFGVAALTFSTGTETIATATFSEVATLSGEYQASDFDTTNIAIV